MEHLLPFTDNKVLSYRRETALQGAL